MSVQFLEARACQCHDLGEPVFGDGVLSMIVVPRRFTPCVCEVSSNRWSQQVKGQLFIDLNTRYSFNLMLFLVLDGENLDSSQVF